MMHIVEVFSRRCSRAVNGCTLTLSPPEQLGAKELLLWCAVLVARSPSLDPRLSNLFAAGIGFDAKRPHY